MAERGSRLKELLAFSLLLCTAVGWAQEGCDYLIICHPDFEQAADTLAEWKRKSGFLTRIATTDETGSTNTEIKNFIVNAYNNWDPAPSYLLLIGDAEKIPCFYNLDHPYDLPSTGLEQGKVGSDFYYGDVNDDRTPDIAVGRLPVDTLSEANLCVNRVINYERNPPDPATHSSFYTNAAMAAYFQDSNPKDGYADRRFAKTSEDIYQYLGNHTSLNPQRIYYAKSDVNPTNWSTESWAVFENDTSGSPLPDYLKKPTFPWDGSGTDISNAINSGVFFVTHRDHGARKVWFDEYGGWYGYSNEWSEPEFQDSDIDALTNSNLTPVIWSINCMTGWFDNETDKDPLYYYSGGSPLYTGHTKTEDESFCEHFLLNSNGGAVGIIGATRISYSGRNDRLAWGWMDAIWPDFIETCGGSYGSSTPIHRMGDVLNYGKAYFLTKYSSSSSYTKTTIDEFHWFGDPTMEIWTGIPQSLTVSHPSSVPLNIATDVTVTVQKNSSPVEGVRVTISRSSAPDDYWTDETNSSGSVTFSGLTATQEGNYDIVVVAHNCLPYEGVIASEQVEIISITVSPTAWAIGKIPLSDSKESGTYTIQNDGNVTEDFEIRGTNGIGGWEIWNTPGQDRFTVEVDRDDNGSYGMSLTTIDQSLYTSIGVSESKNIGFRYSSPTSDTKSAGVNQNFDIIITASKSP